MRKTTMLLIMLALSMPAYGEILIYKGKVKGERFDLNDIHPRKERFKAKDYLIIDVNMTDWENLSVGESLDADDATRIVYGRDAGSKWYCEETITTLTIYKLAASRIVIVIETDCGSSVLIGSSHYKNLGYNGIDKVPITADGYYLVDARFVGNMEIKQKLDLRRTRGAAEGSFDIIDATTDITLDLQQKGYTDVGDCCDPT